MQPVVADDQGNQGSKNRHNSKQCYLPAGHPQEVRIKSPMEVLNFCLKFSSESVLQKEEDNAHRDLQEECRQKCEEHQDPRVDPVEGIFHFQLHCCLLLVRVVSEEAGEASFVRKPHVLDPEGNLSLADIIFQKFCASPVFRCLLCILVFAISVEMNHPRERRAVPPRLHACGILPGRYAARQFRCVPNQSPDGMRRSYYSELSCTAGGQLEEEEQGEEAARQRKAPQTGHLCGFWGQSPWK